MITIGVFGATGCNDFGDYAMLINNIKYLNKINKEIKFIIFSYNLTNTENNIKNNLGKSGINYEIHRDLKKYFKFIEKVINKLGNYLGIDDFYKTRYWDRLWHETLIGDLSKIPDDFIEAVKKCDFILFDGGGYIQNNWKLDNIKFMTEINCAKHLNKEIYFLGSTIGPVDKYEKYIAKSLNFVKSIMIRDNNLFSRNNLINMNYEGIITNGPDDLLFVEQNNNNNNIELKWRDYVIIEIMPWIGHAALGKKYIIDNIIKFCNYIISKKDQNVLLINFHKDDIDTNNDIQYIINNVDNKSRIDSIENIDNIFYINEIYKNCNFSLSFRYHPLVLALGNKKPCVGVVTDKDGYYYSKFAGAITNLELNPEQMIIDIDSFKFDLIVQRYEELLKCSLNNNLAYEKLYDTRKKYILDMLKNNKA